MKSCRSLLRTAIVVPLQCIQCNIMHCNACKSSKISAAVSRLHVSPTDLQVFCFQKVVFPNVVFPISHKSTNTLIQINVHCLFNFIYTRGRSSSHLSCLTCNSVMIKSCSFILSLRLDSRLHINWNINFHKTADAACKYTSSFPGFQWSHQVFPSEL